MPLSLFTIIDSPELGQLQLQLLQGLVAGQVLGGIAGLALWKFVEGERAENISARRRSRFSFLGRRRLADAKETGQRHSSSDSPAAGSCPWFQAEAR
jgi:hypothetical protein